MSHLRVDTSVLRSDAEGILSELNSIESDFNQIYDDIKALGSMWKGVANYKFTESFSKDYESIKEFLDYLKKYVARIENESKAYNDCENNVISLVEGI